ncbi:polyphenol oxidase family protein [Psychrobacter sp. ANT_WB68]|uniref:polyphenol oxidase family protein n=1 Tax=Psychrobacter sp. ANT_WB68 TaxID=2597355 RepID=UPI0011F2A3EE|nr:polyphenol oxidase family protein [Psychrobacter sp. ANT_WB68]KAA0914375.1 laccase domain-containing protein [Psychrobacter sp. ANT_WB68]
MKNTLPMTLLTQLDDIAVFQTAAFAATKNVDVVKDGCASNQPIYQQQHHASYGALNLGLHVNDDAKKVLNNRMRLLTAINEQLAAKQCLSIERLHWVNQVHGNHIHDIDKTALSMEPMAADAMVSRQSGLGLAIMTADCVPIVLYQPTTGQIAAIHAGWQGLACGVIKATSECFESTGPIKAWIGVCISQENYEVGTQVRDKLLAGCIENQTLSRQHLESFEERYVLASEADKIKLNLPQLAADQLNAAGIIVNNQSAIPCSYADPHYYSYRRQTHLQQPATGRMALVIVRSLAVP